MTTNAVRLPRRTRSALSPLKKNVRNDNRGGKGIRRRRSVNNDCAEDDTNDDNVGERDATAADDGNDGGNGEEDCVNNDSGGGDDWGDVDVDNNDDGVASLFPCLPPIIVESDRDHNGGRGAGVGGAGLLHGIAKMTTTQT